MKKYFYSIGIKSTGWHPFRAYPLTASNVSDIWNILGHVTVFTVSEMISLLYSLFCIQAFFYLYFILFCMSMFTKWSLEESFDFFFFFYILLVCMIVYTEIITWSVWIILHNHVTGQWVGGIESVKFCTFCRLPRVCMI